MKKKQQPKKIQNLKNEPKKGFRNQCVNFVHFWLHISLLCFTFLFTQIHTLYISVIQIINAHILMKWKSHGYIEEENLIQRKKTWSLMKGSISLKNITNII